MKIINAITDDAQQNMIVLLDDGTKIDLTIEYIAAQQGWFISMVYGDILTISRRRVVTSPNMLRAFRHVIPFGMACITNDGYEPIYKDDFSKARASIYILNPDDVTFVETEIIPASHD